jgi:hypothetical protein
MIPEKAFFAIAVVALYALTFVVGALGGAIGGYLAGRPGKKERDQAQAELDACYDAGYRDGREDVEIETLLEVQNGSGFDS